MVTSLRSPRDSRFTLTLLELALGGAWVWMSLVMIVSDRIRSPAQFLLVCALLLLFGLTLASIVRGVPRTRECASVWLRLLLLTLVASIVFTDLYYLIAVAIPLVLPRRPALRAFLGLVGWTLIEFLLLARFGKFEVVPGLEGVPSVWGVALTIGYSSGLELLGFAGGLLAATEARERGEVARLMAELELTNRLLGERSREAERLHISRELHDSLGHGLVALGVHLDLAGRRATPESAAALGAARDMTRRLLSEVRDVVSRVRHSHPFDLRRALVDLLAGISTLDVELTLSPGFDVADPERGRVLFRCIQEGLTNAIRHAGGSRVWLDLRSEKGDLSLCIRDDGPGVSHLCEGHGLRGMRERLESLGGTLQVGTDPGRGVALMVRIPAEERA